MDQTYHVLPRYELAKMISGMCGQKWKEETILLLHNYVIGAPALPARTSAEKLRA